MRWPIRNQILVPFALLMLGVVCGVSVLNAFLAAQRTQEQIDTQLREVAHTLHDSTFPLTDAVLRQTRGLSGAEFILTNSRGEVQSASLVNAAIDVPATPTVGWEQLHLGPVVDVQGQRYFHAAIALRTRDDEGHSEQLHLLYPEAVWRQARWQAAYPPLVVGAAALAVVAVLALVIASRLSRPIDQLRSQVGRLAQGDFQPVPLPARDDELRDLVGSVNSLAEQLDQLRQAIKRSERLALLGQLAGGLAHHLRNNVTGARLAMQFHQRIATMSIKKAWSSRCGNSNSPNSSSRASWRPASLRRRSEPTATWARSSTNWCDWSSRPVGIARCSSKSTATPAICNCWPTPSNCGNC